MYSRNNEKGPPFNLYNIDESAYYLLADRVGQVYPEGAPTMKSMYDRIGRGLGMSQFDFNNVIRGAIKSGYLLKQGGK